MDYFLTEEHQMVKDLARQIATEKIAPVAHEFDEKEEFPRELFQLFAESDLFAIPIPEEFGGMGIGQLGTLIVIEELSRACAGITLSYIDHIIGYMPLLLAGTSAQKEMYLPDIVSGKSLFAFALTEDKAGSDVANIKMTATKANNQYILNGSKFFVTNGGVADFYTVFASTDPELGKKGISCFLIPKETKGLSFGPNLKKMGVKAIPLTTLHCDHVALSEEFLIGKENQGLSLALKSIDFIRPAIAAQAIGIAQSAMENAAKYATERIQFGRPIADFEAIQFMLADMAAKIECCRSMMYCVGKMMDQNVNFTTEAAMIKYLASDMVMNATIDAVQIFGGYGYMKEYPVEKLFRDAKVTQIYAGTNQIQKLVIARHVLDHYGIENYQWSVA